MEFKDKDALITICSFWLRPCLLAHLRPNIQIDAKLLNVVDNIIVVRLSAGGRQLTPVHQPACQQDQ